MPAPFTSESNRNMFSKIIVIYAVFYIVMKLVAVFQGAWLWVNLILCLPFVLLAIWGGLAIKRNATSWLYVIVAILIISAIRYFEPELMVFLHDNL